MCDLDKGSPVISGLKRAFHNNPDAVECLHRRMNTAGMSATLKHYLGHGQKGIGDLHHRQPVDSYDAERLLQDAALFRTLAPSAGGILSAHVVYTSIDAIQTAGSSERILTGLLRQVHGYQGLILGCFGHDRSFGC